MIKFNLTYLKDESTWVQIFKEALINEESASLYAKEFVKYEIRMDLLSELTRGDLKTLGISKLADILSILKYAKQMSK